MKITLFFITIRQLEAYSNEKPGVPTETLCVYLEPQGVQFGRLGGVAVYTLRDYEMAGPSVIDSDQ